jgi:hypothetical protein
MDYEVCLPVRPQEQIGSCWKDFREFFSEIVLFS